MCPGRQSSSAICARRQRKRALGPSGRRQTTACVDDRWRLCQNAPDSKIIQQELTFWRASSRLLRDPRKPQTLQLFAHGLRQALFFCTSGTTIPQAKEARKNATTLYYKQQRWRRRLRRGQQQQRLQQHTLGVAEYMSANRCPAEVCGCASRPSWPKCRRPGYVRSGCCFSAPTPTVAGIHWAALVLDTNYIPPNANNTASLLCHQTSTIPLASFTTTCQPDHPRRQLHHCTIKHTTRGFKRWINIVGYDEPRRPSIHRDPEEPLLLVFDHRLIILHNVRFD